MEDIHDAFKDKKVKAILTTIGGFNVNQILDYLDYDLIKNKLTNTLNHFIETITGP